MSNISIKQYDTKRLLEGINAPFYFIIMFEGEARFSINYTEYKCKGNNLIFLSPYQILEWKESTTARVKVIEFHGDFYCIEYHKKEVACNGILFNNIYQQPFISIENEVYQEIISIYKKIENFGNLHNDYDISIVKTYLQLILALSSKQKQKNMGEFPHYQDFENITHFQNILEQNFIQNREVHFYADKFGLSVNTFSKKIKKHFGKSPSKLIQERLVLEAKKLIHLTTKPIKEIAMELNFEDEFYFSRYFKKEVGISPNHFRKEVGISIVAK